MTSTVPNPGLTAPDELAGDIQFPTLDESLFNMEAMEIDFGPTDNNPLNWTTQVQLDPLSIEAGRGAPEEPSTLYEDDLGLELDIETGRDAPPPRPVDDDLIDDDPKPYDDDLGLDLDDDESLQPRPSLDPTDVQLPEDENMVMDIDQTEPATDMQEPLAPTILDNGPQFDRISQSPLSSVRSSEIRDFDETTLIEEPAQIARQPTSKRRKLLPTDRETMLPPALIKQQQNDRSAILKPLSLLPKDPLLLALMTMQQSGGFVSSIMGDGRSKGLAPQLRGLLSIEAIRKAGTLKRKRDSGVADLGQEGDQDAELRIEIPEEDDMVVPDEAVADLSKHDSSTILHIPGQSELDPLANNEAPPLDQDDDDDEELSPVGDNFDETRAPLLYPDEQGPISVGTQHAVHVLRDFFGGSAEAASSRKGGALFQDLYPERTTTKAEATKMFFETLVLATKDAIKVEQSSTELGAPIRIRPKRNLWGEWAEREAGGEIAANENDATAS